MIPLFFQVFPSFKSTIDSPLPIILSKNGAKLFDLFVKVFAFSNYLIVYVVKFVNHDLLKHHLCFSNPFLI